MVNRVKINYKFLSILELILRKEVENNMIMFPPFFSGICHQPKRPNKNLILKEV